MSEPTPELEADLPDLLRMVARMATVRRIGKEWREIALAISNAAEDVELMSGLVIDGEVYSVRTRQEYAACGCKTGEHPFSADSPWFTRGHWQETRDDAAKAAAKVRGHVVTRLVAYTTMEVTR